MHNKIALFRKLIDEDTSITFEKNPKRLCTTSELQESIVEDLSMLLNTRVASFWKECTDRNKECTVPFAYGTNVTDTVFSENAFDMKEVELCIDDAIRRFEPRLIDAKSSIVSYSQDFSTVFINIDAVMITENHKTQLSFPVVLEI
ncbi:MAG: GPW/gp25 family protein [Holosporaceae bacterium]|jgi:predicted component of type VI protein secretion system|nr:GPW/gp25 family protein [Holosporaceae bacterium]